MEIALKRTAILAMLVLAISVGVAADVVITKLSANRHPPAIAEGQISKGDWLNWEKGSSKFTASLVRSFPVGTDETALVSSLLDQGFRRPKSPSADCVPMGQEGPVGRSYYVCPSWDPERTLTYEWGGLPCSQYLSVWWTTDGHDHITLVEGHYGGGCM